MRQQDFHSILVELQKYKEGRALHVVVEKAVLEFDEADRVLLHRLNSNIERLFSVVVAPSGAAAKTDIFESD